MNAAYQAAVESAAKHYDPRALSARNEREGIAAERIAREWSMEFTWVARETLGHLHDEQERIIARFARERLVALKREIGERNYLAAGAAFVKARGIA